MITLISPRITLQKYDTFTTGIVYMPFLLAYLAGHLKSLNIKYSLIDCFGEDPENWEISSKDVYRGINNKVLLKKLEKISSQNNNNEMFFILYAINASYHQDLLNILKLIRKEYSDAKILIAENSQAVTAYAISSVKNEFFALGADALITGDLELSVSLLYKNWLETNELIEVNDGVILKDSNPNKASGINFNNEINAFTYPDWDQFPLQNYWKLGYGHGPTTTKRYLPIVTSRGCPYPCRFCVIPATNSRKWRARDAESVVSEISFLQKKYGVSEFHLEDVDSTIDDKRTKEICQEIINKNLKISWKIVSGTKVESLKNEDTVKLAAKSGCDYISISPESGSKRVMKLIKKPFNYIHAVKMISEMNKQGIMSQACFVLGFPGENVQDRIMTWKMVLDLSLAGVSEIAVFIISPMPGSDIFDEFALEKDEILSFSPNWRGDYEELSKFRKTLYLTYIVTRFLKYPFKSFLHLYRIINGKYKCKSEMVFIRGIKNYLSIKKRA